MPTDWALLVRGTVAASTRGARSRAAAPCYILRILSLRGEATNVVLGIASGSALSVLVMTAFLKSATGSASWNAAAIGYTAALVALSLYTAVSVVSVAREENADRRLSRVDRTMPLVIAYAILLGIGCIGAVPAAIVVWRCMRLREASVGDRFNSAPHLGPRPAWCG